MSNAGSSMVLLPTFALVLIVRCSACDTGTVARSVDEDAPSIRVANEAQQQQSASAVEAAVREAHAALRSVQAEQAEPPLPAGVPKTNAADDGIGGGGGTPALAELPSSPGEAAAGLLADLSSASAYAATALAPQPSVLEPPAALASRQAEHGEAASGSPDEGGPIRQGIKGTVSRLKALFENNQIDR